MIKMKPALLISALISGLILIAFHEVVFAAGGAHAPKTKYAGQEGRAIKSLSQEDIDELRRGGGWGLAKAAELNGISGPAHLLEMKDELSLSSDQVSKITAVFEAMRARAVSLGERLIDLERDLEARFRNRTITDDLLRFSLTEISDVRAQLRYTHLSAHLKTPDILSEAQIQRYNALRGYDVNDPCRNMPTGHDPEMWRKHNGCK